MNCENCTKYDDCRARSGLHWPCGAYQPKVKPNRIGCPHLHPDNGSCIAVGRSCASVPAENCPLIQDLKAEKERLLAKVEYEKSYANSLSLDCLELEIENDNLRKDLERVTKERDKAISDLRWAERLRARERIQEEYR